jgi:hypothetical protein
MAVEHDELSIVLLSQLDGLPRASGDEDSGSGMGESGLKTSGYVRPVLDDDDESFEGRCAEH